MILDLFKLKEKYNCSFSGVLHIGAHYGGEYPIYKNLNISPIIFIEAVPETYNVLINNVGLECLCLNTAIGNIDGIIDMNISSADPCSSILEPDLHLQQYPEISFVGKRTVKISKIDSLNLPKCNFLNLDVQGYELEVLKGAEKYLHNIDYVMSEVNRDSVYKKCVMVEELDDYLKLYGLERVETDWAGDTWGDAFYIKTNK